MRVMTMVLISLTLVARLAMRTEREAKMTIRMMFWAMPDKVVSGLRIKVMPSTIRKKAIIKRFRIMMSTLFEIPSTFFIVSSKSSFLDFLAMIL